MVEFLKAVFWALFFFWAEAESERLCAPPFISPG